jgi:hypothetical protein
MEKAAATTVTFPPTALKTKMSGVPRMTALPNPSDPCASGQTIKEVA